MILLISLALERGDQQAAKDFCSFKDDLEVLGEETKSNMLREDFAGLASEMTGRPAMVLALPGDCTGRQSGFNVAANMYGDYRAALTPEGLALDQISVFLLCNGHFSLLLPTSNVCLGYCPDMYPEGCFADGVFERHGCFSMLSAGGSYMPVVVAACVIIASCSAGSI